MDRYFIVAYYFTGKNKIVGNGDCTVNTLNGKYVNKPDLINHLKKQHEFIENIVIMNIIEVSKDDYLHYNSKTECAPII